MWFLLLKYSRITLLRNVLLLFLNTPLLHQKFIASNFMVVQLYESILPQQSAMCYSLCRSGRIYSSLCSVPGDRGWMCVKVRCLRKDHHGVSCVRSTVMRLATLDECVHKWGWSARNIKIIFNCLNNKKSSENRWNMIWICKQYSCRSSLKWILLKGVCTLLYCDRNNNKIYHNNWKECVVNLINHAEYRT